MGVSVFFPPVSTGKEEKGAIPCSQTTSAPEDRGQSFNDALEIIWVILIVLRSCWFYGYKVAKISPWFSPWSIG